MRGWSQRPNRSTPTWLQQTAEHSNDLGHVTCVFDRALPTTRVTTGLFLSASVAWADRWDVRREIAEGNREIRRELRGEMREERWRW